MGRRYSSTRLKNYLAGQAGNPTGIRKLLATFILLGDNEFPSYRKLWDTLCKTLGDTLYTLLRIQPQQPATLFRKRIVIKDPEAFLRLLAGWYANDYFGKIPLRTVVRMLHSIVDMGYSCSYFYQKLLNEINLRKNNNNDHTQNKPDRDIHK